MIEAIILMMKCYYKQPSSKSGYNKALAYTLDWYFSNTSS